MTVAVNLNDGSLCIELRGWSRVLAMKREIRVPLKQVAGIRLAGADAQAWGSGFKVAGARLPGIIKAGTFREAQSSVFWYVRHPEQAVLIDLRDGPFARLIIEVPAPDALIAQVQRGLAG